VEVPEVKYAKSGDVHIAYQVTGEGPFDLVFVPGYVTHLELHWAMSSFAPFLERLSSFSRRRWLGAPLPRTRVSGVEGRWRGVAPLRR
jgi:hypothetical protein